MEMSALTFFSWAVISTEGWSFLVVEGVALEEGPAEVELDGRFAGGWLAGGVGSRWLSLTTRAVGL